MVQHPAAGMGEPPPCPEQVKTETDPDTGHGHHQQSVDLSGKVIHRIRTPIAWCRPCSLAPSYRKRRPKKPPPWAFLPLVAAE